MSTEISDGLTFPLFNVRILKIVVGQGDDHMSTKTELLALFEKNKGVYLSGEEIANKLSISSNAVWKSVNSLRHFPGTGINVKPSFMSDKLVGRIYHCGLFVAGIILAFCADNPRHSHLLFLAIV